MKTLNKKGFTLVELMVVVVIIAILATGAFIGFQGYISRAQDSTRLTHLESLNQATLTYKGNHIAPPLNQHALVGAGFLTALPTDPANKKLYQYNADIRGWSKKYMGQGAVEGGFLWATNQPLTDINNDEIFDGPTYSEGKGKGYSTKIRNLKYYGGYLVFGDRGDASLLTDNGNTDDTTKNKSAISGGPAAPSPCGSVDAGGTAQLDPEPENGDITTLRSKVIKNTGITLSEIYGDNISGSICKIIIKSSDGSGKSPVDLSKDLKTITKQDTYENYYK